jgi:A/G-specific adenine glycosylase
MQEHLKIFFMLSSARDFQKRLFRWYQCHRRDLPWRRPPNGESDTPLNPYHVLVSEMMLQQTQVATVIPYFTRFIARFPTFSDLASADLQEVLKLWQGLGYYSRAKNLRRAAQMVIEEFGAAMPSDVPSLLKLPGVGRYSAGAIASIAFERRAPILDGNVARVLCRLDAIRSDPRERVTQAKLWQRAEEILPKRKIGDFNSALMELGATVCTPRNPHCLTCPVRDHCEAFAARLQDKIPPPRKRAESPLVKRWTFCIRRGDKYLLEQRPATGRWAGMWQFLTREATDAPVTAKTIRSLFSISSAKPEHLGNEQHTLTHRRYHFAVFFSETKDGESPALSNPYAWVKLDQLHRYPLPRPHLKIAERLK